MMIEIIEVIVEVKTVQYDEIFFLHFSVVEFRMPGLL